MSEGSSLVADSSNTDTSVTQSGHADLLQQAQQNWMYYQHYNMMPNQYMNYYQYWTPHAGVNMYAYPQALSSKKEEVPVNPPLPKGPPPPPVPQSPRAPLLSTPKQFGNIRFNLNGKRPLVPSTFQQNTSQNSGAAKKKRKRNRNNQQQQQQQKILQHFVHCDNGLPPLPPPETNTPKPEPPPELPPDPPLPPEMNDTPPLPPVEKVDNENIYNNNPAAEWPDSLKNYVKESYAKCKTSIDKNQVEIILKGKITQAYKTGQVNKDWSKEPLPSIHSERLGLSQPLTPKTVTGQLAQFQNQATPSPLRKGLSSAMGARLGTRASTLRGKSRSESRSKSKSPATYRRKSRSRSPKKRRSSSQSSSSDDGKKKSKAVKKNRGKLADRLGPTKKITPKQAKKAKIAKEKKAHFYSSFGSELEENTELLQQRAARFNGLCNKSIVVVTSSSPLNLPPVTKRQGIVVDKFLSSDDSEFDWEQIHVVGTCQDVEKSFLRLTKAPAACEVRPVQVLRSSLRNVKDRWRERRDYYYACDQLKSIRQDLTVQGIRSEFTVEVYETHARIALEKGDHEEFNQCQTQLKMLYADLGGAHKNEFTAYRILYYIFTKNTLDIMTLLKTLSIEEKKDDCIRFALKMRSAWGLGNFHRYFKLYLQAPLMSGYLVDWFIERERKDYLKCMIKCYRQNVPLSFLMEDLAFKTREDCLQFLEPFGLTFTDDSKCFIDCKSSMSVLPNL
ncbi:hypothetical protein WA026_016401 [Henosepilachna vigintioctopunctata]|uniref:PCI domain-containing protein n=1 Tax=Henosepilachna vigintioctopunctata TaxID=420089 RepID=A0AAW1UNV8_9CUCU